MKVDFLIIGTQKGGTTTLHHCLSQHSSIQMADKKEVHFFDQDEYFSGGDINYSKYHESFSLEDESKILGEATPIYMYWKNAIPRIHEYNSKIKLIVLLRNPVERAFSQWQMETNRNLESLPFAEAINREMQGSTEPGGSLQHEVFSYLDRGKYAVQIHHILHFFKRSQVLFLKSENFKENPNQILTSIYEFLDIPNELVDYSPLHRGNYANVLSAPLKRKLIRYFYKDIRYTEKILGWDCRDWIEGEKGLKSVLRIWSHQKNTVQRFIKNSSSFLLKRRLESSTVQS